MDRNQMALLRAPIFEIVWAKPRAAAGDVASGIAAQPNPVERGIISTPPRC